ncbi:hypothetical protein EZJ49_15300 [Bdellovibrio bacteriovorus]|uniref:hypothetical protein n=1 Tax=Bdellovibrio bacteriovorus TaxID=959 RepID=UPI0021D2A604|nr:hypothetical protein [Bdellovibrio bacteriovorus]UXR64434.1 hypothetical protein EZJ49_15300 [Bdellovibrio bacteriovorus]
MKPMWLIFINALFTLLTVCSQAGTKKICTMTLNSADEKQVLQDLYASEKVEIIELVPTQNKNPYWLQQACNAGIECDVLLVSGHFGGVFFGEGVSTTLDLKELERLSCSNSCPGILKKPKDVFLMGCNTLATKTRDKRSIEEYVEVLIKNGFPRDLAERVAFSRYSDFGMSISQIFASAFPHAERLHGFASTGPLGKVAGPLLRQALRGTNAEIFFSKGPDTARLNKLFAGSSYRIVEPRKELDQNYKTLTCNAFSNSPNHNQDAITFLSKKLHLKKYYEPLLEATENPVFMMMLKETLENSTEVRRNFESFFTELSIARSLPLKMKVQIVDLQAQLGLIPEVVKFDQQEQMIRQRLNEGLNFIVTDQFCAMKDQLKNIELKSAWLRTSPEAYQFIPRLSQCFGSYDMGVESLLKEMMYSSDPSLRRESLRALKGHFHSQDYRELTKVSTQWPRRDRLELKYSTGLNSPTEWLSADVQACLQSAASRPDSSDRDGARWGCYNSYETVIDSPVKCHEFAGQFETQSVTGIAWSCLTRFEKDIHLGACLASADYIPDPENSDDVRWFCWSKLSQQNQLSRSECLALASSMKIQGNRFKANWNCMNRLK